MPLPLSSADFVRDLYAELLEDGHDWFEQRVFLLREPRVNWSAFAQLDQKLANIIEALAEEPSLRETIADLAPDAGPWAFYVAVRALIRLDAIPLIVLVLGRATDDSDMRSATGMALAHALSPSQLGALMAEVDLTHPGVRMILAKTMGRRHVANADVLEAWLRETVLSPADYTLAVVDALGRLGTPGASAALWRTVWGGADALKIPAIEALLRSGDPRAAAAVSQLSTDAPGVASLLAMTGGRETFPQIRGRSEAMTQEQVRALGILGDPRAIPPLLELLSQPELAQASARSLYWITGAELWETVEVDEDSGVERLSHDTDVWRAWLTDHLLTEGRAYRLGREMSPTTGVSLLANRAWRDVDSLNLLIRELQIRYGAPARLDLEDPWPEQLGAIEQLEAWARQASRAFRPGRWYLSGTLL